VEPIGYVLARVGDDPQRLTFRYRGSYGGAVQALFLSLIGTITFALVHPIVGYLTWGLAGVLLLGAIGSGLGAWDLTLDTESRTWLLLRGYRFWQRPVGGTFDDFASVTLAEGRPHGWWIYLVPKGSQRGYVIDGIEPARGTRGGRIAMARIRGRARCRCGGGSAEPATSRARRARR